MLEIRLSNIRCFASTASVKLAPLTILVGENSTGKSTFLAFVRICTELLRFKDPPSFNVEPFLLGPYSAVARRTVSGRQSKSFEVSIDLKISDAEFKKITKASSIRIVTKFMQYQAFPRLSLFDLECGKYRFKYSRIKKNGKSRIFIDTPSFKFDSSRNNSKAETENNEDWTQKRLNKPHMYFYEIRRVVADEHPDDKSARRILREDQEVFRAIADAMLEALPRVGYQGSPVRTRPLRTYEPLQEGLDSEGSHVPTLLAFSFSTDANAWLRIRKALERFGKASGMFETISVRRLGKSISDPFRILVEVNGNVSNIADVGYGVSQILPLLVDLGRAQGRDTSLIQQPEIHLHPKAQAELGSVLCEFIRAGRMIVVETHSDYLVDRVRLEVRNGTIDPTEVSLLFFAKQPSRVSISSLQLDKMGNVLYAPTGYREFFLHEEKKLLGI